MEWAHDCMVASAAILRNTHPHHHVTAGESLKPTSRKGPSLQESKEQSPSPFRRPSQCYSSDAFDDDRFKRQSWILKRHAPLSKHRCVWTLNSQSYLKEGIRGSRGFRVTLRVDDMTEQKAGDETGAPRRVERHGEASVGMRKGSNGKVRWSSVKGPHNSLPCATWTQYFTLADAPPCERRIGGTMHRMCRGLREHT